MDKIWGQFDSNGNLEHILRNSGDIAPFDATAQELEDCCCGGICPDPSLYVTLSWTDSDTTKDYMGKTFTNGETKEFCPDYYEQSKITTTYNGYPSYNAIHVWRGGTYVTRNGDVWQGDGYKYRDSIDVAQSRYYYYGGWSFYGSFERIRGVSYRRIGNPSADYTGAYFHLNNGANYGTTIWTKNLSTYSPSNASGFDRNYPLDNAVFGQMTTNSGVTISWERGSGNWPLP